jgi:hypothetical protein
VVIHAEGRDGWGRDVCCEERETVRRRVLAKMVERREVRV